MKVTIFRPLSIIALLITFASCSTDSTDETAPAESANYVVNNNYAYSPIELEIAELINQYRESKGLNSLEKINHISNVAEDHDEYMISVNTLTHALFAQREDNLKETLGAVSVGENIAYNYSTAQSVVDAWLASPSHKANIEGNYTHCGISVRENAEGKKYFTNLFIRK
ncbi:CAP domain-containing protein [Flavobacterium suncheonense]|uniref:Allergen V5/Tpx-1 family protein n=1 Tax=Flavobacterium suncheonense GH29-5 = DSM 17707 TaxID=1121899 RepID=A0A0A2MFY8_9FLAO|nr:CAP domain-containing protein [Flavobacterium suncheonense]KGO87200.1 Allergen V5/Tpx-1 family protein [Flavobacterium suncheonense GH29-5 = DSM 17707]